LWPGWSLTLKAQSLQVIDLTRQQELTKQTESKAKEAEYRAQAAAQAKVSLATKSAVQCSADPPQLALLASWMLYAYTIAPTALSVAAAALAGCASPGWWLVVQHSGIMVQETVSSNGLTQVFKLLCRGLNYCHHCAGTRADPMGGAAPHYAG
jgi:hypothetical protein